MNANYVWICDSQVSLKFGPFVYLSLPIPIKHTDIHLTDCLRLYTAPEYLSHPNSWYELIVNTVNLTHKLMVLWTHRYCPKCKTNREARKQIHFWRLPHVVIIQLKRFCFDLNSCPEKITGFVDFPLYNLDLSPYCLSEPSFSSYDLYAVVNHYGDVNGGHYTAFCRDSNVFKGLGICHACNRLRLRIISIDSLIGWRRFDDNRVDDIREDYVITRNAYILFYKRKEYKSNL